MQLSKSYQLIRKLASGGMAEVFLARTDGPKGFSKTLVLKRILPHLVEDEQFVEMFLSEARLVAQLNHPNVVQIFDFGEFEDAYFLAMEYIDGPNLRALWRQAARAGEWLPPALCAKIISYACEGLGYAHDFVSPETGKPLGLIHRDVSGDNILVSRNGAVKVVDFGIAKVLGQAQHTKTGTLRGKLPYMPPEQLQAKPLDRRVDVFALGMVLYELLCGKRPFDATGEVEIMSAILYQPLKPIRQRRPEVPEALEQVLQRALAKSSAERYPSCRHLRADLERFILSTGEPVGTYEVASLVERLFPLVPEAVAAAAQTIIEVKRPWAAPAPADAPSSSPAGKQEPSASWASSRSTLSRPVRRWRARLLAAVLGGLVAVAVAGTLWAQRSRLPVRTEEAPLTGLATPEVPPAEPEPQPVEPLGEEPVRPLAPGVPPAHAASPSAPEPGGEPPPSEQRAVAVVEPVAGAEPSLVASITALEGAPARGPKKSDKERGKERGKEPIEGAAPAETRPAVGRPPATEQPAEQGGRASVVFESSPPAQVRVNGQFAGFSPVTLHNLEPGLARVQVYDSVKGFAKEQAFTLEPGDNGVRRVVVGQGTLELRIQPSAVVLLNGRSLGRTPLEPFLLYEGRHSLRVESEELNKAVLMPVLIEAGETRVLRIDLSEQ